MRFRRWLAALACVAGAGAIAGGIIVWRPAIAPMATALIFDRATIETGAKLAAIGDCAICHEGAQGQPYAGGRPLQTPFGAIYATNITPDRATGIGNWSQAAFVRAMREGVDRAGNFLYPAFPYIHYARATDADIGAIYAFLMTRQPVQAAPHPNALPFPLNLRPVLAFWDLLYLRRDAVPENPARSAAWNRGAYLAEGLGHCAACHTPHNALGAEIAERAYQGGDAEGWSGVALAAGTSPAPLAWTVEQFEALFRNGIADGHSAAAGPMMPVSHDLSSVDESDVHALATYFASIGGGNDPAREQKVAALIAASRVYATTDPPIADPAAAAGSAVFAGACAGCHGIGAPMMLHGRPSLALGSSVAAADPRNAIQTVLHGLQPRDGERGPYMPGFAAALTDAQIEDVLRYLRARFTDRSGWSGLGAQIGRIRANPQM